MNADRKEPTVEATGEAPRPMDFSTFVLSLGSSAMVNLGLVQAPGGEAGQPEPDLPAAKQIIEILDVLKGKTKGNLDTAEEKLLSNLLYDLRVRYVDAQKRPRATK